MKSLAVQWNHSSAKMREGQSTRRTNDSKNIVMIITVWMWWLWVCASIEEVFCCRRWQLTLVTPKRERKKKKRRNEQMALQFAKWEFFHFIIIHVFLQLFSISFHHSCVPAMLLCCKKGMREREKPNIKRLNHKRPILSEVLVMINHNGVQLLNIVWYACCGNNDHKYPAVAFIRCDQVMNVHDIRKGDLAQTTYFALKDNDSNLSDEKYETPFGKHWTPLCFIMLTCDDNVILLLSMRPFFVVYWTWMCHRSIFPAIENMPNITN